MRRLSHVCTTAGGRSEMTGEARQVSDSAVIVCWVIHYWNIRELIPRPQTSPHLETIPDTLVAAQKVKLM